MKGERKLSQIPCFLHLFAPCFSPTPALSPSDFSAGSSSFVLALLQQLSGWFHSDATQTPLIVFFVISSHFLCKSETPFLTSTPTHLQNGYQPQLCSDSSPALARSQSPSPQWLFGQTGTDDSSAALLL